VRLAQDRLKATKFTIARLFNVYGPEETNPHVIPDILQGLKLRGPLRLGNLEPIRDYVYIADVVDALIRLGQYEGDDMIFNVATGDPVSVREVIKSVERILNRQIEVSTDSAKLRKVDRPFLGGNNSLAVRELKWKPAHSLESGLHKLLVAEGLI
jgi:UDP-glucose 4-epimerase